MKKETEKKSLALVSDRCLGDVVYTMYNNRVCEAQVIGMSGFIDEDQTPYISLLLSVKESGTRARTRIDVEEKNCFLTREGVIASLS